ncbi:unnamed protein product [Clonostachys chloroleuca]|uniref:DUF7924 domain-containing protein n=1 Tax=Clonostachys chloroleuca TaxID=1926264 RepID=A0AA35LUH8_9HYPO|nr:unnamed protein product [Clonostachys chloroleuca]CAI6088949.1 unnamed protein product [Clonostachys chloroleuca]CAI6089111.1 unnamed protein product [Clonostachys chloroleuca]CAI6089115.1 unnamed protein product [Clonostachys chloroleuca]
MEHLLARKKSLSSLGRKRSNSTTSTTPNDQKPREEKSAPYKDPRYKTLLATKGSFMDKNKQENIFYLDQCGAGNSKWICISRRPLKTDMPKCGGQERSKGLAGYHTIDCSFSRNSIYDSTGLKCLIESVNEGWNNSIPLTGTRPQPDYSVGFGREDFTNDQLAKLSPFLGDFIAGDRSFCMGTYYMYFSSHI